MGKGVIYRSVDELPKRHRTEARRQLGEESKPVKANKYKAKRASDGTRCYDSTLERDYALILQTLEKSREISCLEYQPKLFLNPRGEAAPPKARVSYKADFSFIENGNTVYVDTKGKSDKRFPVIMKLWHWFGPSELRVVKKNQGRFYVYRSIQPIL